MQNSNKRIKTEQEAIQEVRKNQFLRKIQPSSTMKQEKKPTVNQQLYRKI